MNIGNMHVLNHVQGTVDVGAFIRQLHRVVDAAITTQAGRVAEPSVPYDISAIDFELLRREFERSSGKKTTVQNLMHAVEARLHRMLQQNPLRTDFQEHYEQIVADYNREKDRQTIEATFEALMKLIEGLTEEETRAMREGLDQETLALFDILTKPDLTSKDIERAKRVAAVLLETLKAEKLRIEHWRDRENTRDAVRVTIHDFLYSDQTGLPVDAHTEDEVTEKTDAVFQHVFRAYPTVPSPFYGEVA